MLTASPRTRVGLVGLGAMGTPMARRLVDAGFHVVGFDVADDARQRAAASGVEAVDRVEAAATAVSVLILMLPDSNVVEAVLKNEDVLGALSADVVVVDMSSSEPVRTREIATFLEQRGTRMLDAPVSGGVAGAEKGTLTVMVGGSLEVFEELRALLAIFGKPIHVGPIGSGHAVKALNNLLSATHLLITGEAMLAGERFGLDPVVMLSVFNQSSGRSGSTENKWPNFILTDSYDSGFGLRLMLKDMRIAVQLAEQSGVPSELGREAVSLWSEAAESLPKGADHTEIARWLFERQQGDAH